MSWTTIDDKFPTHPKVIKLSDAAFRLHVAGICYCAQNQTDGWLDAGMIPLLVPRFKQRSLIELLERKIWIERGDTYEIHDFLQWNRSKAQVDSDREKRRSAGRKGAEQRWHTP